MFIDLRICTEPYNARFGELKYWRTISVNTDTIMSISEDPDNDGYSWVKLVHTADADAIQYIVEESRPHLAQRINEILRPSEPDYTTIKTSSSTWL